MKREIFFLIFGYAGLVMVSNAPIARNNANNIRKSTKDCDIKPLLTLNTTGCLPSNKNGHPKNDFRNSVKNKRARRLSQNIIQTLYGSKQPTIDGSGNAQDLEGSADKEGSEANDSDVQGSGSGSPDDEGSGNHDDAEGSGLAGFHLEDNSNKIQIADDYKSGKDEEWYFEEENLEALKL